MERLGSAIREAETTGIPWTVDESKPNAKHVPKAARFTKIDPFAAAALRLHLFTGCRLREILHLRWEYVDLERGCLFLPDSKSGRKHVFMPEVLRPSLIFFRSLAFLAAKQRQRLPEAMRVEVRQSRRRERLLEDGPDRTGAAPLLAVQSRRADA